MERHCFKGFYRVFKNDTAVTEISFNDFRHVVRDFRKETQKGDSVDELFHIPYTTYSLMPENERYCGYEVKTHAMEMAKADALKHIEDLISEGPAGIDKVYQYRFDHYEDLNINLTDSTITRLKNQYKIDHA
jgi:hypothetical protein